MDIGALAVWLIILAFMLWTGLLVTSMFGRRPNRSSNYGGGSRYLNTIELSERYKKLKMALSQGDVKILETIYRYRETSPIDLVAEIGESGHVLGGRLSKLVELGYVVVTEGGNVILTERGERYLSSIKEKKSMRRKERELIERASGGY